MGPPGPPGPPGPQVQQIRFYLQDFHYYVIYARCQNFSWCRFLFPSNSVQSKFFLHVYSFHLVIIKENALLLTFFFTPGDQISIQGQG